MSFTGWILPIIAGGSIILLGILAWIWGTHEEKQYFEAMARRGDLREFMTRWPKRPEPGAIKVGAVIATVVGLVLLVIGLIVRSNVS